MAKFLKGNLLNAEIEEIFDKCDRQLIIISPFIKLHTRFINSLKAKKDLDKLYIRILFGKNENDISRSFNKQDFEFLKEFPNIEIRYNEHLHAKYYSNDTKAVLSSMNLYEYSQNNNIEFGILTNASTIGSVAGSLIGESLDSDALNYFEQVIKDSKLLFERKPLYTVKLGGLKRKYETSETLTDKLSDILYSKPKENNLTKKIIVKTQATGYCIRTGEEIKFNPEKPLSNKAYKQWSKYGDEEYPEKFCHFSGEKSNGETSLIKPILRKNWKKSMKN